jgi:beta-glucosidase
VSARRREVPARGRALALGLTLALLSLACRPSSTATGGAGRPRYRDPSLPAAARAADLVGRLTRAEKVAQLMTTAPAIPRLGVPEYDWWNEALHGVGRAGQATVFPQAIALAATFDEALVRQVAEVISDEARAKYNEASAHGVRGRYHGLTFFTPNLNIFRDPRWGRGQETFGEDPLLTARMGVAFIGGLQGDDPRYAKTIATAKHFAVHSGPEASRHRFDARPTAHDLVDTYLPQFEAAVREGRVGSVMAAYNRLDGEPCAASPRLLGGTLRGAWGFGGYVVGDCGAVEDIFANHHAAPSPEAAAAAALRAGTDLDCGRGYAALGSALEQGLVADTDLDRAVVRLFTARFRLGLFDPPDRVPWSALGPRDVEAPAHLTLARRAAARSIVLLENRDNTLPFGPSVRRLAVVGPTADDVPVLLGNYNGTPSHPVTLLDGIRAAARARGVSVSYARGARLLDTSDGDVAEAVAAARGADVVIAAVGLDPRLEGEERDARLNRAGDRADIRLPAAQERLLHALGETGHPLVVVLTGGSALAVPWASVHAAALLDVFYPGGEGGNALADVLFGDVDPAGRLPFTVYRELAYLPSFDDYAMMGRTYRYIDLPPLYPFGHGRSYTTFRYTNLETALASARAGTITVDVANTGLRAGDEVVEVYLVPRERPRYAPYRWLAGFTRILLAPGERRRVQLALPATALTLVDENGIRRPLTGEVAVAVGGGQPDYLGRYADDARGISGLVRL